MSPIVRAMLVMAAVVTVTGSASGGQTDPDSPLQPLVLPPKLEPGDPSKQSKTSLDQLNEGLVKLDADLKTLKADLKNRPETDDLKKRLAALDAELVRLRDWMKRYQQVLNNHKGEGTPPPPEPLAPTDRPEAYAPPGEGAPKSDTDHQQKQFDALLKLAGIALCIWQPELCPLIAAVLNLDLGLMNQEEKYETVSTVDQVMRGERVDPNKIDKTLKRLTTLAVGKDGKPPVDNLAGLALKVAARSDAKGGGNHGQTVMTELGRKVSKLREDEQNELTNLLQKIREQVAAKNPDPKQAAFDTLSSTIKDNAKSPHFRTEAQKLLAEIELTKLDEKLPGVYRRYWVGYLASLPIQTPPK